MTESQWVSSEILSTWSTRSFVGSMAEFMAFVVNEFYIESKTHTV
jgi:hypothetical protein